MTFADVIRELRVYEESPVSGQEPSLYVAEPWSSSSEAVVEWSMPKGGLPAHAAKHLLLYVASVREVLSILGDDYEKLRREDRIDEMCELIAHRILEANAARIMHS